MSDAAATEADADPPVRVLIVDDHHPNLVALGGILDPLGLEVVSAGSGEQALIEILRHDFALILMDVQMPQLDGFATASLIKNREKSRHIPIIFLTALSRDAQHIFQGYAHGAVDYLLKPFDPEILRSKVRVFVDLYRQARIIQRQERELRRRDLEAQALKEEARFRGLVDALPGIVWALDAEGTVTYANHAWRGAHEPAVGARVTDLPGIDPDDADALRRQWTEALAAGEPFEWQARLCPPAARSGEPRWHLGRAAPRRDERGGIVGWLASATDIDDRKRRELVHHYASRASARLAEARGVEATVTAVLDLVVPELAPAATVELVEDEHGAGALRVARGAEGGTSAEGVSVPLGALGHLTVPSAGDEARPRLEDLARRAATALERARLLELAERERTRAEDANRVKDAFLATVSHELRTPLTPLLGYAAMLVQGRVPAERLPQVYETLLRSVRAQARLIDDLLDVSRITAGKLRLEVKPVAPVDVVEAALDVVRPSAAAKQIHLAVDVGGGIVPIPADADRLQQVIWNLVANAIKFTPAGGHVTVGVRRIAHRLEVTVTDDGTGIAPDFLPHVFEPFRQEAAPSGRPGVGGLGLGLAISKRLVELHGGTIGVTSEGPGKGARFSVVLPSPDGVTAFSPPVDGGPGGLVRGTPTSEC